MPFNHEYEPSDREIDVLELLKREQRYRPADIYNDLDVDSSSAQHWLRNLYAAGWIGRPKRGLYEFRYDPREMDDAEIARVYVQHARELDPDGLGQATTPE